MKEKLLCEKLEAMTFNDLIDFIKIKYVWILGCISLLLFLFGVFSSSKRDFFTAASVILAAIAIFENIKRNNIADQKESSRFYLEKYIAGSDMVMELLVADKPTRRMTWVSAAAISEKLKDIENNITEKAERDFLKIYQSNYMHQFINFIKQKTGIYFYGIDDAKSLDEAAEKCKENHGKANSGLLPQMKTHDVDETDITKVLQLINPAIIDDSKYSIIDENGKIYMNVLACNHYIFPGLYEYLKHKQLCEFVFDKSKGCKVLKPKNTNTY